MQDIFIRGLELPAKVKGVTVIDNDSNFNIYINTLLCADIQRQAVRHELIHIKRDHFYDCEPVIYNELEASAG